MARIRSIKPEFWKNEKLGEMSCEVQLLFIGLWNLCDKRGFLEDRPKRIKAEIFPYKDIDVDSILSKLDGEFIRRIDVNGIRYIHVLKFTKHQVINVREPESTVPEQYWNSTGTVPESGEGKGREGKGSGKGDEISPHKLKYDRTEEQSLKTELENSDVWHEDVCRKLSNDKNIFLSPQQLKQKIPAYMLALAAKSKYPITLNEAKDYFSNWLPYEIEKKNSEQPQRRSLEKRVIIQ